MSDYKVYTAYFSATGTTERGVKAVAEGLGGAVALDFTLPSKEPGKKSFGKNDVVVLGSPVYGGRIPAAVKERLERLRGDGTPCVITVTYGNRHYDDALVEMYDMAAANGFLPFAAAALVGQHTFGRVQVGRPDADDCAADREFGKKALEKLAAQGPAGIAAPGARPYKDGGSGGKFRPLTGKLCTNCKLCAGQCPMEAIDWADVTKIDDTKCISCFRCIRLCPTGAKNMDTEAYKETCDRVNAAFAVRRENEYFL